MIQTALEILLAPALIGVSWAMTRRYGQQVGGLISAFPAIAGPFLLLVAIEHGPNFAASAANGTLAGLVALGGFAVAYALAAPRSAWRAALALGWVVAGALAGIVDWLAPAPPVGLLLAAGSLLLARSLLPDGSRWTRPPPGPRSEALRSMALGALLVCSLALAAAWLGPEVGGILAGLPVIATALALETHRRYGVGALHALLRGMLDGMVGFVLFCETVTILAVPAGTAIAFAAAAIAAVAAQATLLYAAKRPQAAELRRLRAQRSS
jgi:hypothetical protein